ncbi:MAG TPA: CHAT domain-containing protein, partial [Ktedonobacterales bacterium]
MLEYLDFDVQIAPLDERDYSVSVASPAGEATGTFHLPFDETALENLRLRLENTLLRSSGPARRGLNEDEQAVQRFGHALFEALMTDRVGRCYAVSRDRAEQEGKGLRLRLRIHEQAPGLAALPWEYLYNKDRGGYLCLSRYTPIVRYLHLPRQREALHVTPPLRILGMIASPKSNALHALDVEKERASLKRDLSGLISRGLVELEWLPGETWRDLQRAMRRGPWHIFHFIGHGGFDEQVEEGVQALADEEGKVKLLHANKLGTLLSAHPSLRLALLNSCEGARASKDNMFSSVGATLAREGIPAVLAMQYDITDSAAQELTTTFYESLADGLPVDAAVTEVRVAIKVGINNSLEWGTPVLYMRSSDGVLFTITGGDGVNHRPEPDPPRSLIQSEPIPEPDPPRPPIQSEAAPEDDPPRPPIQSEPPVRAADATRKEGDTTSLSDCLSTLTKDNLFTLFMYLTFEHEEKEKSIAFD